jgi:hypothetical protein
MAITGSIFNSIVLSVKDLWEVIFIRRKVLVILEHLITFAKFLFIKNPKLWHSLLMKFPELLMSTY